MHRHNQTLDTKMSITWFTHQVSFLFACYSISDPCQYLQNCEDMFVLSKWNQSKTYSFEIKRDFGTDYGICCWYTPQLNFTEIDRYVPMQLLLQDVSMKLKCWTDTREKPTYTSRTGASGS